MSQSPLDDRADDDYLGAFDRLSTRIRAGDSFSGGERNCAFLNRSGSGFRDLSFLLGLDALEDGRGVAALDIDGDGDQDLCTTARTAPRLRLLRNDLAPAGRSIRILLIGDPDRNCPRDAIGARVELRVGDATLRRTLFAGDGFVSQSSKWLHFGMASGGAIGEAAVRWPGGGREVFTGIDAHGSYVLRQGSGAAQARPQRTGVAELAAGPPPLPEPASSERIRLSQPLLLPAELGYRALDGGRRTLAALAVDEPLLVNLWASWCAPCMEELSELADSDGLRGVGGARVIALNVEGLEGGAEPDPQALRAALDSAGYEGEAGYAEEPLVQVLDALLREAVYRHHRFPLPSSFLIDKGGWLSVIYKGPMEVEQLLDDRAKLGRGPETALREALPFAGISAGRLFPADPAAVAAAYAEGAYLEDAIAHLRGFITAHPVAPGATLLGRRAQQRAEVHAMLGKLLSQAGDAKAALAQFKAAARFHPDSRELKLSLARATADAGETGAARRQAGLLRDAEPGDARGFALSGDLEMMAGQREAAISYFEQVLSIEPGNIGALNNLAWIRSTAPEAGLRDGAEALRLAELLLAVPRTAGDPNLLSTAAAAHAEAGRYRRAVELAEDALRLVEGSGDERLRAELRASLDAYRAERPFRPR